jgi:HSP20 family protein
MDVCEDANNNTVTASFELPGLKKEDVRIDVHNNRLTISGESKTSADRQEEGFAVRERSFGSFARTLHIPAGLKVCLS